MKDEGRNIYSVFDEILNRVDKEKLLNQKGIVIWITGLSGSGKTTIAKGLERKLHNEGVLTQLLDGDNIRTGINNNLGFSLEDRTENIRRISEIAKLFLNNGTITICCFVSPTIEIRAIAKNIIGPDSFLEVFINTPISVCEARDVKGLYAKARSGEIQNFTGIDSPFEAPDVNFTEILTDHKTVEESVEDLYKTIIDKIKA
ncbi:MAG: adenylylsulfate kinase [Parvicellaceae bacterium]|jgi:adenylylsulfate kinase